MRLATKTKTSVFLLTITFSSMIFAEAIDPPYTIERSIYTIKINADKSSEETEELTTRLNTQVAVTTMAEDQITFKSSKQSVKVLEAYTILPNGRHIAVDKKNIHIKDQENDSRFQQFSDKKVMVIVYPNIEVGSKTYYKVVKKKHQQTFKNQYEKFLAYDPSQAVKYVEYNIEYAKNLKLFVDALNLKGGRISDGKNGQIRYQYTYSHPSAFSSEPDQIDSADYEPHLHISSYQDPLAFGRVFQKTSQPKILITPEVNALANKITVGITDDYQQAKAIYNWVSKEIRYVADLFDDADNTPHETNYIIDKRYGDCKDHNNLLIALLTAKNIQASSALINAGDNYKLTKLGSHIPFDHVITYLPKWGIYLDSTIGTAPFGNLSLHELDKPTLLTGLDKIGQTKKAKVTDEQVINDVKMTIQADGSIVGTSETRFGGSKEILARSEYMDYEGENKQLLVKNHFAQFGESGTGTYTPADVYDLNTPFTVTGHFTLDPVSNIPGNGAIVIPVGLAESVLKNRGDVRPEEKIHFPYSCHSFYGEENTAITFPDNVKVTKIPAPVLFNEKGINYQATYQQQGNTVTIKRSFTNDRPSTVCNANDLDNWKVFHKVLKRDLRSQIIYE